MYKNFDLFLGIVSLLSAIIIYIIDSDSKGIALVVLIMGIVFILTSMIRKRQVQSIIYFELVFCQIYMTKKG